jgi:hypothetical protein
LIEDSNDIGPVNPEGTHSCLDLLRVAWTASPAVVEIESAILLEISSSGGLILTDSCIPAGSILSIDTQENSVKAVTVACDEDEFGYLVMFTVDTSAAWFPCAYRPQYIRGFPESRPWQAEGTGSIA